MAGRYQSEFYPYRYLAAEGYLPGYNFTRLPIRAFLQVNDTGEYISRPRQVALTEFGPRNLIYHNGSKFEVQRQQVLDLESRIQKAKVSKTSGYFMLGPEYILNNCPVTQAPLTNDSNRRLYPSLIELSEVWTQPRENITCEEEERTREGYDVRTYFSAEGSLDDSEVLELMSGDEVLLRLRYIPAASLHFLNAGWTYYSADGFVIETKTGRYKKSPNLTPNPEDSVDDPVRKIQIYTSDTADAVYVHPSEALGLDANGILHTPECA